MNLHPVRLLMREEPGKKPVIHSRHRTTHAAFCSIRGRKWNRLRASGIRFFVPILTTDEFNDYVKEHTP